jgi:low temperature requirement protein LtrA
LLWDLVFVFAVTQVTALLSRHLTWVGFGRSMLVLALVWWAWSAFVWAANAQAQDTVTLRLALLVAMVLIFVAGPIFAVGVKVVIADAGSPLHDGARLALCGGVALYLLGHAAFRLRLTGAVSVEKIFAIGALLALFGLSAAMPAWSVASVVSLLLAALCALETVSGAREARLSQ